MKRAEVSGLCVLAALLSISCSDAAEEQPADEPLAFRAMTFNTGIAKLPGDAGKTVDEYYGNGLSIQSIIDDTRKFIETVKPDIVAFQEIFHPEECKDIPADAKVGFICETWKSGDPTVAQMVLGDAWQIACHLGKPDECLGVRKSFGSFVGCEKAQCLDHLDGVPIDGCSRGSRVGRGVIQTTSGKRITVVSIHGTSGFTDDDKACREKQAKQVFEDFDGKPAASGERNLILGDFNIDPGRITDAPSAIVWNQYTAKGQPFHFITDVGDDAPLSYQGFFDIDHVISDVFDGSCWVAGLTEGKPTVTDEPSFDHKPIVCDVNE